MNQPFKKRVQRELQTVTQTAEMLQVSVNNVYYRMSHNQLDFAKVGSTYLIAREDAEAVRLSGNGTRKLPDPGTDGGDAVPLIRPAQP